MRILHVTTTLEYGGVERVLLEVSRDAAQRKAEVRVVSLSGVGPIGVELEASGVTVVPLGLSRGPLGLLAAAPIGRNIRDFAPDVVHAWMYHACLLSTLAYRRSGLSGRLLWAVHNTNLEISRNRLGTVIIARWLSLMSGAPKAVVYCSNSARDAHEGIGYRAGRSVVIENGVDTSRFRPDAGLRAGFRRSLGLAPGTFLVGIVSRWNPQKDVPSFLKAASILRGSVPEARFACCGSGLSPDNKEAVSLVRGLGLGDSVHLLGPRGDVTPFLCGLDAFVLPSVGESFPLALTEAMACALPCVATDAGDSWRIMGGSGLRAEKESPRSIADALSRIAAMEPRYRLALGEGARKRVSDEFARERMLSRYASLYGLAQ